MYNLLYFIISIPLVISFNFFGYKNNLPTMIKPVITMVKPVIPYKTILDIARLNVLMYEYDKTFKLNKNQTINEFINETNSIENIKLVNQKIFKELSLSSPCGSVNTFIDDKKHDIQCGITISEANKRITVVFRGSDSYKDWIYNLKFNKITLFDDVKVHKGYYILLHQNIIYEKLFDNLKKLLDKHPDYELYITGHSAGSGLGIIFGYNLSNKLKKTINILSFAAPRIGNLQFKNAFDRKENIQHYRITNEHDIVPALPFFFDYHHVGNSIHLNTNFVEFYRNYSYNYYKFSLFNCFSTSDHCMYKYFLNLKNNPW